MSDLYSCPDCAFSFDAMHANADGSYSCPVCAETRLEAELARVRAERDDMRKAYEEEVARCVRGEAALESLRAAAERAREALKAIALSAPADDGSPEEHWTIRRWLDQHGQWNGDIDGRYRPRLTAAAALSSLDAALRGEK